MSTNTGFIRFHYLKPSFRVEATNRLKSFIRKKIRAGHKEVGSLDFIFCDDEYLLAINREFLNHDYYTDIITFDLSTDVNRLSGEIYISVDRVRENAAELSVNSRQELLRVIFHGVLHLLGHKDKTKADQKGMRLQEDNWLKQFELFHTS
jgi:probable rRNA maturation factor